jgi:antitoxin component YwqK of YwqJK toxin-antitoxin module
MNTRKTVFYYENGNLRREEHLTSNGEVYTYDGKEIKSSVFYTADGQKSHNALYEYRNGLVYKAWYTYPNGVQDYYVIFTYDEQGKLKTESYYTPGGELIREISREDKKLRSLGSK